MTARLGDCVSCCKRVFPGLVNIYMPFCLATCGAAHRPGITIIPLISPRPIPVIGPDGKPWRGGWPEDDNYDDYPAISPPPPPTFTPTLPAVTCSAALECTNVHSYNGGPILPFKHCDIFLNYSGTIWQMGGSGGPVNIWQSRIVPAAPAGLVWKGMSPEFCRCMIGRADIWNPNKYPRDHVERNSNWNLKCQLKACDPFRSLRPHPLPIGFNAVYRRRWDFPRGVIIDDSDIWRYPAYAQECPGDPWIRTNSWIDDK